MDSRFDPAKDAINIKRHGLSLTAADGFEWETAVIREDGREPYGEQRFQAMGYIGLRLHVLIYCLRGDDVRVISLRHAEPKEMRRYAKA